VLISPTNQVLLLHRVETSSSFPSAHVFPGGNVSAAHDGNVPDPEHPARHVDSDVYRMAAVRETFEESGILLARNKLTGKLLNVHDAQRERARKDIRQNKITFPNWLANRSGVADIGVSVLPPHSPLLSNH
jgi:8-oxo-dGTP pyrophosphatase MutT (NUDIX family)